MKPTVIYHRSPAYLALRIIVLEAAFEILYLMVRFGFETLGKNLGFATDWFGPVTQLIVFVLQILLLIYLLVRWSSDTFELRESEIVVRTGIAPRREVAYSYNNMQSITVTVSILGRILGAGQVSAYVPTLGSDIIFAEMSRPHDFAAALKQALPYSGKNQFIVKR